MNDTTNIHVRFQEGDFQWSFSREYGPEGVTWKELLSDFLRFLDGSFGYDISGQVTLKDAKDPLQMDLFRDSFGGVSIRMGRQGTE